MITDNHPECTEVMVMFRIISRHDWDTLQSTHKACPGSTVEHLYAGITAGRFSVYLVHRYLAPDEPVVIASLAPALVIALAASEIVVAGAAMQPIVATGLPCGVTAYIVVAFSTIDDITAAVSPYLVVPPECNYGLTCIRAFDNLSRLSAKAGPLTAL